MLNNKQVRVIKRGERAGTIEAASRVVPAGGGAVTEREIKTVVSGWVSEHRRRAEEFRQTYTSLLKGAGFTPARG